MMSWIIRRGLAQIIFLLFALPIFAIPSSRDLRDLKVRPRSEIFFTQMENCYALEILGISPSQVMIELPDLPPGTRFISSKKEEFISPSNQHGTLISLWFSFSDSGETNFSPLLVRIGGKTHYIEFEPTFVYENPALIQPSLEIFFENKNLRTEKDGTKTLSARQGEKLTFTVALRYGTQVLYFKWNIPKDSIFSESERFDFANGTQKITQFTTERKNLARFEWQILKAGEYALPEITVGTFAYNGSKKQISLPQNIRIIVAEKTQKESAAQSNSSGIFKSAFEKPAEEINGEKKSEPSREECKIIAEQARLSLFDRIFSRKFGIFSGGQISAVPEENASANHFGSGKRVRITESAGEWAFIECEEFSGWTKKENLFLIK